MPYYLEQAFTAQVELVLLDVPPGTLLVSAWLLVEFASVLARLQRMGALTGSRTVFDALEEDAREVYVTVDPASRDFQVATRFLLQDPALGLRGPDALHLAIAQAHDATVLTLDRRILSAARSLGVDATDAGVLGGSAL